MEAAAQLWPHKKKFAQTPKMVLEVENIMLDSLHRPLNYNISHYCVLSTIITNDYRKVTNRTHIQIFNSLSLEFVNSQVLNQILIL